MSEFIWLDDYKIGHATVDAQHQHLFELANKIVEAGSSEALTHLFMLFYQHVREHFEAEEQLMKQCRYPGYVQHISAHNQMLEKLNEISETIFDRHWQPAAIKAFVTRWVLVHIREEDRLMGEYMHTLPEYRSDTCLTTE
ncbi:hemerythrin domain-containing protein [Methylomonas sp. MO1]|uniref:bacteriohemerythrin n=1 Tax=unclassified Methylomonas TaxID=2608980 RepID=UPI000479E889|nr:MULTISPECIES: hemerythrin domain-containing protein [unclassified Methylomonas]MDT4292216.1 hemerythrin domain-containing protein [Methylomonas sp. MO1]